jgi:hypothetical protein
LEAVVLKAILILGFYACLFVIIAWIMLRNAKLYFSNSKYFPAFACGVVGIACLVLPIMEFLVPVGISAGHNRRRSTCMNNLAQIGKALCMYSMDHNEQYPQDLQTLAIEMKLPPKLFICPQSKHVAGSLSNLNEWTDYVYIHGLSATNDANVPVVFEFPANHNGVGGNVLYNDGSLCWWNAKDLRKCIQEQGDNGKTQKETR